MPKGCRFEERCSKAVTICKEKAPELIEIEEGHKCRCWLYNESGDDK
jgi:peptide/nickel transport system ATP-binding protein